MYDFHFLPKNGLIYVKNLYTRDTMHLTEKYVWGKKIANVVDMRGLQVLFLFLTLLLSKGCKEQWHRILLCHFC